MDILLLGHKPPQFTTAREIMERSKSSPALNGYSVEFVDFFHTNSEEQKRHF